MSAFAVGFFEEVRMGPEIARYLEEIDATLALFGGRFRVHGAEPEFVEGDVKGHLVMIEFPDLEKARAWYRSDAYQAILPLRLRNTKGFALLVPGVAANYRAANLLAAA